jgi:phosphoglycerate-specific signal transduction histidine kinase
MIEPIQILLFAVIITLTILVVIIGLQIYYILSEVRKIFSKFNTMAAGAVTITNDVGQSFHNLSGFSQGLRSILSLFGFLKNKKPKKDEEEESK